MNTNEFFLSSDCCSYHARKFSLKKSSIHRIEIHILWNFERSYDGVPKQPGPKHSAGTSLLSSHAMLSLPTCRTQPHSQPSRPSKFALYSPVQGTPQESFSIYLGPFIPNVFHSAFMREGELFIFLTLPSFFR